MNISREQHNRLREIKDQIKSLMEEAHDIVTRCGERFIVDRARAYWLAHIFIALDNEHDFLGNGMCTFEETIKEIGDRVEDNKVKISYENVQCPNCGDTIPDDVEEGDECENCGHVIDLEH